MYRLESEGWIAMVGRVVLCRKEQVYRVCNHFLDAVILEQMLRNLALAFPLLSLPLALSKTILRHAYIETVMLQIME